MASLTELFGFPPSGSISPSIRLLETDFSAYTPGESFSKAALIGFSSKGPINEPTRVVNHEQLYRKFGYPDPSAEHGSYLVYAAMEFLKYGTECWVLRVGQTDESDWDNFAKTAYVEIPAAGLPAVISSNDDTNASVEILKGVNDVFRISVNGDLAGRTFVIPAGEYYPVPNAADASQPNLVDTFNAMFKDADGVEAFSNDGKLAFRTTKIFGSDASLEILSAAYNVYETIAIAKDSTTAKITGSATKYPANSSVEGFNFAGITVPTLKVRVSGTGVAAIDNVIQTIPFDKLAVAGAVAGVPAADRPTGTEFDGPTVTGTNVAAYINWFVDNGKIPGGFRASWDAQAKHISLETVIEIDESTTSKIAGRTALIQVKFQSNQIDEILGFDNNAVVGTTYSGVSNDTFVAGTGQSADNKTIDEVGKTIGGDYSGTAPNIFTIWAESPGTAGNATAVSVDVDGSGNVVLQVYNSGVYVEGHSGLNMDYQRTNNPYYIESWINGYSDYVFVEHDIAVVGRPKKGTYYLGQTSASRGSNGYPYDAEGLPDTEKIDQLVTGNARLGTGTYALAEPEKIDIDLVGAPGLNSTDIVEALIDLCEIQRRDCMCIIDTPFGLNSDAVEKWHNGQHQLNSSQLDTSYGALYWPWVEIRDPFNRIDVWVPPTGSILGVYAQSERLADVWHAPAGLRRGTIPTIKKVETYAYLQERDALYGNRNAVNVIVPFPVEGPTVWGNKTLQRKATALDRVNVRRLMLYCEREIRRVSRGLLFEPHDERLRSEFIRLAKGILSKVQANRGIYDYKIKCDAELNTTEVIDRNELRAKIGIQPVKAAEFIFIEFTIHRTGSFEESVI